MIDPDEGNGLKASSSAQCQHVRSVATTRIRERRGNVGPVVLGEVRETLALLIDLSGARTTVGTVIMLSRV